MQTDSRSSQTPPEPAPVVPPPESINASLASAQSRPRGKQASMGRGTLYLTVSSLLFMISGYVIHVWLGQYLGPEAYGVYGVIIALMTALNMIHYVGVPQAVSKYIAADEDRSDAILRSGLILQTGSTLIIAVAYFATADVLAALLNDGSLTPYIRTTALVLVPYSVMTLYMGYYNGLHFFKRQATINIVYSIIKTVSVIGLVYAFHIYGAIAGFIVSPLIALAFGLHLPRGRERSPYRPLILFSLPLIAFSLLSTLQLSLDLLFVKALLAQDDSAGYYAAAQNIARIPYFGLSGASVVLLAGVSRSLSRDVLERTRELIEGALRYTLLLLVPGTLLMSATSRQLLEIFYSNEYAPAAGSLSILIFGLSSVSVFIVLSNILSGSGRPRVPMLLALTGLLLTAGSCCWLVPALGLNGAALATTLGSLTATGAAGVAVYRQFGSLVPLSSVLKITAASLVSYVPARAIPTPVVLLPVLYVMLFALYLLILTALKELRGDDWRRLLNIAPIPIALALRKSRSP